MRPTRTLEDDYLASRGETHEHISLDGGWCLYCYAIWRSLTICQNTLAEKLNGRKG